MDAKLLALGTGTSFASEPGVTRSQLVVAVVVLSAPLVPGDAAAEALSFETLVTEPDATSGADAAPPPAGLLGFSFRYRLPTGTEPYVSGSLGAGPDASLSYALGFRQPIRIGPMESLLALGLRQVATDSDGPAPPTAGVELGLPLGSWWSVDAVGGYQVAGETLTTAHSPDWFARAQLSFRPNL